MITNPLSTRRDLRHAIRPGSCFVELPGQGQMLRSAALVRVSPAGFAFEIDEEAPTLFEGACFEDVTVRIGQGLLKGDITIRNASRIDDQRTEIGCLFYPTAECEDNWMSFLAGVEAAQPA